MSLLIRACSIYDDIPTIVICQFKTQYYKCSPRKPKRYVPILRKKVGLISHKNKYITNTH